MMTVEWNGDPRDGCSISYSGRKIIDNLEKPFDWLTGQVKIRGQVSAGLQHHKFSAAQPATGIRRNGGAEQAAHSFRDMLRGA